MYHKITLESVWTESPLNILTALGGYYEATKGSPLVGYAGKYDRVHQYVGRVYANMATMEERTDIMSIMGVRWRNEFIHRILWTSRTLVFCGMPMGGLSFAFSIGSSCPGSRFVFPERKVTALASSGSREQSKLAFGRHEIQPGDRVVIVEDVLNNFSTAAEAEILINGRGGEVIGIAGILNRSFPTAHYFFVERTGKEIPIWALGTRPIPEYKQDAPEVADDVAKGNVVWKPKEEWGRLMKCMDENLRVKPPPLNPEQ